MGNSTERVPIKDLNDVVYYKQVKEYTDIEYETSRDLKKEINTGRLVILEQNKAPRGSEDTKPHEVGSNSSISISDLKAAIREVLPDLRNNSSVEMSSVAKELSPIIVDAIRQEMAKMSVQQGGPYIKSDTVKDGPEFQDLVYVPAVSTAGMVSNIETKKTEISGDNANDALAALRKLNNISNK